MLQRQKQLRPETGALSLEEVGIVNMIRYQLLWMAFCRLPILRELESSDNHEQFYQAGKTRKKLIDEHRLI